jgi:hypothetical protein
LFLPVINIITRIAGRNIGRWRELKRLQYLERSARSATTELKLEACVTSRHTPTMEKVERRIIISRAGQPPCHRLHVSIFAAKEYCPIE